MASRTRVDATPVGERRDGDGGFERSVLDPGAEDLAEPGERAELEVGELVAGVVAGRGWRRQREVGWDVEAAGPVGVGDPCVGPVDPRARRRPGDAGHAGERSPGGGGLLEHAVGAVLEPEPCGERILGDAGPGPRRRPGRALTSANSPAQARTWSTTCEPDAPSQPPPASGSNHHGGVRRRGIGDERDELDEGEEAQLAERARRRWRARSRLAPARIGTRGRRGA